MDFWWIGPYIIGKVLPNNNYLLRKICNNKKQVLGRMRLRQVTPRLPLPDEQMTPQYLKPDPEESIKHDDLYARAWKLNNERPLLDTEYDKMQRRLIRPKLQCDLIGQPKELGTHQELHESTLKKFSPERMRYGT